MTHASKCLMEAFDVEKSHICDGKKMQSNIVEGQNDSVIQAKQNVEIADLQRRTWPRGSIVTGAPPALQHL